MVYYGAMEGVVEAAIADVKIHDGSWRACRMWGGAWRNAGASRGDFARKIGARGCIGG